MAVVVAGAVNKTSEIPMLYLHGGPGMATLENLPRYLRSTTWKLFRNTRALVFFDYRGTGFSEPALCPGIEDSLAAFSISKPTEEAKKAYQVLLYKNCREQLLLHGTDVSSFSSMQLAADAEAIRTALQIPNWSIYGVSFGTTVALKLMSVHSKNITSVILDSPFPSNAPWLDFVRPFDTSFKVLEKNIAADPVIFSRFPSVRNDFVKAIRRLNKNPARIKSGNNAKEYDYNGDDFAWSVWDALLKPKAIPLVPLAIHEIANGNDSILSTWISAFSNPHAYGKFSITQSRAILCYEARPRTEEESDASLLLKYPDFSSFISAFDEAVCNAWRPGIADKNVFNPVASTVPTLILSGEYDPVCPPLFGELTAKTLSKATFIIVPSASHAAIHADDCLRNMANNFLSKPQNPDIKCVRNRLKINFITSGLNKALSDVQK